MKKILEVLQDGDNKIHFHSDLDLTRRPFDAINLIYEFNHLYSIDISIN